MHLLLFLLFPALELYLLVKVGSVIGALNMVIWVFASAVLGMWAVRAQGQGSVTRLRADLAEGRVPQQSFMDGVLLFFAGVLLILPGLITDAVGLFLLVPPFRHWTALAVGRYFSTRQPTGQPGNARIFFFRSSGFGGAPGGGHGGTFGGPHGPVSPGSCETSARVFPDDEAPRQATIIESEAIEIQAETPGPDGKNPGNTKE